MKKKVSIVLNNKKLFDFECDWLSLSSTGNVSTKSFGDADLGFNNLGKCHVQLSYDDKNPTIHLSLDKEDADNLIKKFENISNEKDTKFELPTEMIDSYKKFKESWDKYMHENMYHPRNIMKDYVRFSKGLSDDLEKFDNVSFPTILFGSPALITLWKISSKDESKVDSIRGFINFAFIHTVGIYNSTKEIEMNKFLPLDSYVCCEDFWIIGDNNHKRIYNKDDDTYSIIYRSTKDLLNIVNSYCNSDCIYNTCTEFTVPLLNCSIDETIRHIERAINNWCRDICYMINNILLAFEKDCIFGKKSKSSTSITVSHIEASYFELLDRENNYLKQYGDLCSELTRDFECIFTRIYDSSKMLFKILSEDNEEVHMDLVSEFNYSAIVKMLINLIEYTESIIEDN